MSAEVLKLLMERFDFDEADLVANREGSFSARQLEAGEPKFRKLKRVSGPTKFRRRNKGIGLTVEIGNWKNARMIVLQDGDKELFSRIPHATLYYTNSAKGTHVRSIEPSSPDD